MRLTKEKRAYLTVGQVVTEAIETGIPVECVELDARNLAAHQDISKRQGQRVLKWMFENDMASEFETVGSNGRGKIAYLLAGWALERAQLFYRLRKDDGGQS